MKTRSGFVSNSSSSSFIIRNEHNTIELAKDMIACKSYNSIELLNRFTELLKVNVVHNNIPIMFPSINYETYIYPINGDIYIDTCNNENWGAAIDIRECNSRDEDDCPEDKPYFWDIRNDVLVKILDWDKKRSMGMDWCKLCSSDIFYIFNESNLDCPNCYHKKHPKDTFTNRNNPKPIMYNGPNIRRYQYTRSF